MGSGASSEKKYQLRSIDDVGLDAPARTASRKSTAVYPVSDNESADTFDTKVSKPMSRRGSNTPLSIDPAAVEELVSPLKKKASLARMNSKIPDQPGKAADSSKESTSPTPANSTKGMLLQTSPSRANLLQTAPSNKNLLQTLPAPLTSQPSTRMARSNSIMSRTACSVTYPWLLKNANTAGTALADYEMGRVIGRGLMGTVRITKNKAGKYLVLKAVKKDYIVKHNDHRHIQNEKDILRALNCSFCVKLFGTFQDRVNIYYALEFCPGGELFQRLGRKKYFPPEEAKFYISEVFVALEHVQELGYVYRDLKPENIILDEEGHCKLVDFGFSTPCADNTTKLHTLCGTPAYLSPEQLDGKFTNGYTRVVDWWSFGVLIYELHTGKTPFCHGHKETHYEIFLRILNKKISFPWGFDSTARDLVMKLCHAQLDRRLCGAPDIKEHAFFTMPWDVVATRRLVPPFVPRIKEEGDIHYFKSYAIPKDSKEGLDDGDNRHGYFDF